MLSFARVVSLLLYYRPWRERVMNFYKVTVEAKHPFDESGE